MQKAVRWRGGILEVCIIEGDAESVWWGDGSLDILSSWCVCTKREGFPAITTDKRCHHIVDSNWCWDVIDCKPDIMCAHNSHTSGDAHLAFVIQVQIWQVDSDFLRFTCTLLRKRGSIWLKCLLFVDSGFRLICTGINHAMCPLPWVFDFYGVICSWSLA